jgi:hypothetical protein
MADKILATFRIDPDKWESFKELSANNGSSASAVILQFINNCLDTKQTPSSAHVSLDSLEFLIDKRIEASLAEVRSQLDELRGKLQAR